MHSSKRLDGEPVSDETDIEFRAQLIHMRIFSAIELNEFYVKQFRVRFQHYVVAAQ